MKWEQSWLVYRESKLEESEILFKHIYVTGMSEVMTSAVEELQRGLKGLYGIEADINNRMPGENDKGICLIVKTMGASELDDVKKAEGYKIYSNNKGVIIESFSEVGLLYGTFALLRGLACGKSLEALSVESAPDNPLRMLNHWDNMDGSIERGYSGESFFYKNGEFTLSERIKDYARLLASIGINGLVINNVNVANEAIELITDRYEAELKEMTRIFMSYGIKLYLSLDYAAPMDIGGLGVSDPLDEQVIKWWEKQMSEVYTRLPDLGGFLIKADSEGRPGPFTYGRTHADGANMLAKAVRPFDGTIIWRCFVYNCQQDWRDYKTDRARSGYDNFMPLDGLFDDNVVLQIKNGPMDFQVREPLSPLLGAMKNTNQIIEFQVAQEYTGQQKHVCYLIPMWKEALEFNTHCQSSNSLVKDVVSGKTYKQTTCGIAAVGNTGNDENWTGHDLAAANFYGFGRLAWNVSLTAKEIAEEWIIQTFSDDARVIENVASILMMSWPAYEKYTSPLGIGWMVNPNHHYGPNVDGYEYDRWGTYHRADSLGVGVDRSESGTGYVSQYFDENYNLYKSMDTCPEALLLFFHRVEYTTMLKTKKTLIQHIYDSHFEGAEEVENMAGKWRELEGLIDQKKFDRTMVRFDHQLSHSKEWRDVVNSYFYRKSMIQDEKGRMIY